MRSHRFWTEDEKLQLRDLYGRRVPMREMSAILNRGRISIYGMIQMLGLRKDRATLETARKKQDLAWRLRRQGYKLEEIARMIAGEYHMPSVNAKAAHQLIEGYLMRAHGKRQR